MTPDKIWVTTSEMTALLSERRHDYDVAYIRKDALLEKLNRARELRIKAGAKEQSEGIRVIDALTDLINRL